MVFLKYLMIFFLGLWLIRSILRGLLGRVVNQAQQQQRHFNQQQQQQHTHSRRSGNINVDFNPKNRKDKTSDDYRGGDYIEYEEVD